MPIGKISRTVPWTKGLAKDFWIDNIRRKIWYMATVS